MRIQHNIAALNSYRQLGTNNSNVSKNLERLSSGYKINKAGDDAAGLSISEKMRSQITGLETAQANAQDGISLIQTAEGNLQEVHSMLNRMVELATQSSNGTYSEFNREQLQKEVNSLNSEIDRIAQSANFNGLKLLDGSLSSTGTKSVSATQANVTIPGPMMSNLKDIDAIKGQFGMNADFADSTKTDFVTGDKISYTFEYTDKDGKAQSKTVEFTYEANTAGTGGAYDAAKKSFLVAADGTKYDAGVDAAGNGSKALKAQLQTAVNTELNKDASLKENFVITTTGDNLQFEAKAAGADGAKLTGVKIAATDKDTGAVTTVANAATTTRQGVDAYQALNVAAMTTFNGTNGDKSIIEINGKKFAFVGPGVDEAKIKEAGIDHFVKVAADNTVTTAETSLMVERINMETGLKAEKGTIAGSTFTAAANGTAIAFKAGQSVSNKGGGGLTLQVGDTNESYQKVTVSVDKMDSKSLGIGNIDISQQGGAQSAIDAINNAIDTVSATRGDLGALQNRLDHTISNIGVAVENMTAAESRIRDTDMAKEMMDFTKNNILTQAAQAMLAQANTIPQSVLQLLQ